jgi:ubiquinone/menaquinone biosynthesis C-methylase UbiE
MDDGLRNQLVVETTMKRANSYGSSLFKQLTSKPLWSMSGMEMQKGMVNVTGLALPRDVTSHGIAWEADEGVAFEVDYPLPHPGAGQVYWYWSGADRAAFRIGINLAACCQAGEYYRFRIRFEGVEDSQSERIRTTLLIPKSLQLLQNYPSHGSLQRVHRFDSIATVAAHGLSDAYRIRSIAEMHGMDTSAASILDWGCGHGRVVRFLPHVGCRGQLHGIDIDPENIAWAKEHLDIASFAVGPLYPPLPYGDSSFDLVYGISVMTHLSSDVQRVWLAEIRRVLRPGGLALLTFAGDAATAFASQHLTDEWMKTYLAQGEGPDLPCNHLVGVIEHGAEYYRNVHQTIGIARTRCAEYFTVVDAQECAFGYQDLLVLRKDP